MKLRFAAIALSATLVACGGGSSGSGDDGDLDADGVPLIGGGENPDGSGINDFDSDEFDEDEFIDPNDTFADGCEGGSGTDIDSSTSTWDDNCRLQVGGEHQISSYTQGMQRIIFCRGHDTGLPVTEINTFADGNFGPMTREELRNFQTAEGILADGVVGPETWGALRDVLEFIAVNTTEGTQTEGYDGHGVLPGTCGGIVQFYQVLEGTERTGWVMAQTVGNTDAIPFSVGPPN